MGLEVAREDVSCDCEVVTEVVTISDVRLVVSEITADEADAVSRSAVDDSVVEEAAAEFEDVSEFEAVGEDGVCAAELVEGPVPIGTLC